MWVGLGIAFVIWLLATELPSHLSIVCVGRYTAGGVTGRAQRCSSRGSVLESIRRGRLWMA